MSITIEIDVAVVRAAERATDIHDPAELVRRLLEREVRLRSAHARLASAGGTMPDLALPARDQQQSSPR